MMKQNSFGIVIYLDKEKKEIVFFRQYDDGNKVYLNTIDEARIKNEKSEVTWDNIARCVGDNAITMLTEVDKVFKIK